MSKKKNIAVQSDNIKKPSVVFSYEDDDWMSSEEAICRYTDATGYNDPFDLGEYGHPHESGPDGHGQW
jgi:hypothetical protein